MSTPVADEDHQFPCVDSLEMSCRCLHGGQRARYQPAIGYLLITGISETVNAYKTREGRYPTFLVLFHLSQPSIVPTTKMGVVEKVELPTSTPTHPVPRKSWLERHRKRIVIAAASIWLGVNAYRWSVDPSTSPIQILWGSKYEDEAYLNKKSSACEQAPPLQPSLDVTSMVEGKDERIINWLSGSVKIPTEIYDVMGPVGEDRRYDVFYKFADCG